MPLRDHFRPPLDNSRSWDELHGGWPMVIVTELNQKLGPRYVAAPRLHLGGTAEVDVAALERVGSSGAEDAGGTATAVWAPPKPTLALATEFPDQDEYEVRVFDVERGRRLVAAVELVSPKNKDRPENRRWFVAKCAALIQQDVSVTIVDVVTTRRSNLYGELLGLIGETDPSVQNPPAPIYAATIRRHLDDQDEWRLESWAHTLTVGQPLPTLPLWLATDLAVPLELELTYERTCEALRIR